MTKIATLHEIKEKERNHVWGSRVRVKQVFFITRISSLFHSYHVVIREKWLYKDYIIDIRYHDSIEIFSPSHFEFVPKLFMNEQTKSRYTTTSEVFNAR